MSLIHKGQIIASNYITGDTLPIGSQIPFSSLTIPDNWLLCDGSAISRVDYSELFNVIGTSYGAGNGTTTFNLPNKKGRTSVGHDTTQTEFNTVGKTGGSKDLQKHDHKEYFVTNDGNRNLAVTSSSGTEVGTFVKLEDSYESDRAGLVTGFAGAGDSGNLQPYETDVWIIKAKQSSGVVATVVDNLESTSTVDALSANQGRLLDDKITALSFIPTIRIGTTSDQVAKGGWDNNADRSIGNFAVNYTNDTNEEFFEFNTTTYHTINIKKDGLYLISVQSSKEEAQYEITYSGVSTTSSLNGMIWDARNVIMGQIGTNNIYSAFANFSIVRHLNAGTNLTVVAWGGTNMHVGYGLSITMLR